MTTISDIAKLTGVAKSTISRYLNGGSVSKKTSIKIEQAIKETGYIPNSFAQSLKAKKTNFIGVIVPRLDSYATSRTLIGIDHKLKEKNYQMLISNTNQSSEQEIEIIYSLASQKIAGIILLATIITKKHLEAFRQIGIPVLLVGQEQKGVHCLIHNDEQAGYEIGKYVLEKGHRKIAYLGVSSKDIAVGVKRKRGFTRAIDEDLTSKEVKYFETSFNMDDAKQIGEKIIESFSPTIIVCATDNIALGAMKAAQTKGLSLPEDLSITGFGGYKITELIHPSLTTVNFYYKEIGMNSANNIIKLIEKEDVPLCSISAFEILERESVDSLN